MTLEERVEVLEKKIAALNGENENQRQVTALETKISQLNSQVTEIKMVLSAL